MLLPGWCDGAARVVGYGRVSRKNDHHHQQGEDAILRKVWAELDAWRSSADTLTIVLIGGPVRRSTGRSTLRCSLWSRSWTGTNTSWVMYWTRDIRKHLVRWRICGRDFDNPIPASDIRRLGPWRRCCSTSLSDTSLNLCLYNTISSFRLRLPRPVEVLQGAWGLGVCKLACPSPGQTYNPCYTANWWVHIWWATCSRASTPPSNTRFLTTSRLQQCILRARGEDRPSDNRCWVAEQTGRPIPLSRQSEAGSRANFFSTAGQSHINVVFTKYRWLSEDRNQPLCYYYGKGERILTVTDGPFGSRRR